MTTKQKRLLGILVVNILALTVGYLINRAVQMPKELQSVLNDWSMGIVYISIILLSLCWAWLVQWIFKQIFK